MYMYMYICTCICIYVDPVYIVKFTLKYISTAADKIIMDIEQQMITHFTEVVFTHCLSIVHFLFLLLHNSNNRTTVFVRYYFNEFPGNFRGKKYKRYLK